LPTERQVRVRDALDTLPARQRKVIEKWYGFECEHMTLKEIADEEGVSRQAVRQAQKKGEKRLKTLLEESLIGREAH
jgi:RNA polymerase primary sigma factor